MDDLELHRRKLTIHVIGHLDEGNELSEAIDLWEQDHEYLIKRWKMMLTKLQASDTADYAMYSFALRELLDLVDATEAGLHEKSE